MKIMYILGFIFNIIILYKLYSGVFFNSDVELWAKIFAFIVSHGATIGLAYHFYLTHLK